MPEALLITLEGLSPSGFLSAVFASWPGFIDDNPAAIKIRAVQTLFGLLGGLGRRHLDKTKASALQDVNRTNLAKLGKKLSELVLGGPVIQVTHVKFSSSHQKNLLDLSRSLSPPEKERLKTKRKVKTILSD